MFMIIVHLDYRLESSPAVDSISFLNVREKISRVLSL
jgi:hypothetical protein